MCLRKLASEIFDMAFSSKFIAELGMKTCSNSVGNDFQCRLGSQSASLRTFIISFITILLPSADKWIPSLEKDPRPAKVNLMKALLYILNFEVQYLIHTAIKNQPTTHVSKLTRSKWLPNYPFSEVQSKDQ